MRRRSYRMATEGQLSEDSQAMKKRTVLKLLSGSFGALLVTAGMSHSAIAGPPSILSMFQERSAAVSEEQLALKDEHGPWLILAMTLVEDDAETKAIALAKELQTMLKAPCYVHRKEFDTSQPLAQASARLSYKDGDALYTRRVRNLHAEQKKAYAVLVGNFTSPDDPRIEEILKKVKTAQPKCLATKDTDKPTPKTFRTKIRTGWSKPSVDCCGRRIPRTPRRAAWAWPS